MNTYNTHDIYLAAFLLTSGIALAKHERKDGKSEFGFTQTKRVSELINSFYSINASVNPLNYAASLRNLKGTMYNTNTTTTTNDNFPQQFRKV
jgi:Domain of unknown function (DUF5659)